MNSNSAADSEILSAKREAERTKDDLAVRLRASSKSSRQMLERTLSQSRPILTAVAALGAAAVAIGLFKLASPRARRVNGWVPPPREPSIFAAVARSALASAAASLASYIMERLRRSLEPHAAHPELPATRAAGSHHRP